MASRPNSRLGANTPSSGPRPGELSPSFAQTGAELSLDDSDIDDLDLVSEAGRGGHGDVYEMRERTASGSAVALWDETEPALGRRKKGIGHDHDHDSDSGGDSVASFQLYTPDEEAAVRRKFDRKLVVFVALLYTLSFLDRSSMITFSSPPP